MDWVDAQNGLLSKKVASYPGRGGRNLPSPHLLQWKGMGTAMAIF